MFGLSSANGGGGMQRGRDRQEGSIARTASSTRSASASRPPSGASSASVRPALAILSISAQRLEKPRAPIAAEDDFSVLRRVAGQLQVTLRARALQRGQIAAQGRFVGAQHLTQEASLPVRVELPQSIQRRGIEHRWWRAVARRILRVAVSMKWLGEHRQTECGTEPRGRLSGAVRIGDHDFRLEPALSAVWRPT
jgi:hypothetical protein